MSIMQSGFAEVKLTQGLMTIIDVEDLELVSQYKWCAHRDGNTHYAVSRQRIHGSPRRQQTIKLHRVLLNPPAGMYVDHINGNGLCNIRANLRLCTNVENGRNRRKQAGTSSEFKGVSKLSKGQPPKPWLASIKFDKKIHTRCFATELEAAQWYDEMAREHFGEFAKLNFPNSELEPNGREDEAVSG